MPADAFHRRKVNIPLWHKVWTDGHNKAGSVPPMSRLKSKRAEEPGRVKV
jgi:hypothetical protein